jgi:hypothetical protein
MAKSLIIIGIVILAVGIAWLVAEKFGLGRLPGDIVIERPGYRVYIPVMTSIVVSIVLSLILWFFNR